HRARGRRVQGRVVRPGPGPPAGGRRGGAHRQPPGRRGQRGRGLAQGRCADPHAGATRGEPPVTAALITPMDAPSHPRWPAERFYWALIQAPGYTARGELPPGLRPALEEQVPVPVETLHAVVAPASNGALLVCAAAKSELESLAGDALSLTPAALPAFAVDLGIAPDDLNLLVGALEPRAIRRGRACRRLAALTAVVLCAA